MSGMQCCSAAEHADNTLPLCPDLRPFLRGPVKHQLQRSKHVASKDAVLFVREEVASAKRLYQEQHVQIDRLRAAPRAVEGDQLVPLHLPGNAEAVNGGARKEGDVRTGIDQ